MLRIRVIKYLSVFAFFIIGIFIFNIDLVSANYSGCKTKVEGTNFYDCGNKVYTYYEDKDNSSILYSLNETDSILYAGKIDGMDIFYAREINYFNVSYDDRSLKNNNLWTKVTSKGSMVFDGSFKDYLFLDDGHRGYHWPYLRGELYTIRQYHKDGELVRTMVIYNYKDTKIDFSEASYDGIKLALSGINEVLDAKEGFEIGIDSHYGIKKVEIRVNDKLVESVLTSNIVNVDSGNINNNLIKGVEGNIEVKVYDYLGMSTTIRYRVKLLNNEVSVKFSTMTSIIESDSRRIVIEATAGKGKTIDTDYCWYYWSTSPDDSLIYEEFLKNYANSSYKGSYSEDKGVILRNTSGTYYLYALAKDDDSWTVVRSDGYILNHNGYKVSYNIYDAIFIVMLAVIAIVPISIYLYVRKKGY